MVNLCNGWSKDFVELWEIIYLNILTYLKHYSQTCSNNLLCKTTNAESAQANSRTIVTVQDDRLPNANSDHFFLTSKWKKTCLKQWLQNFIQRRNAKKT